MDYSPQHYEKQIMSLHETEVAVLRNIHHFPTYGEDFISSNLVVGISHRGYARCLYDSQKCEFFPNDVAIVLPNHTLCPISSTEDYDVTLLVLSPVFFDELKVRTLRHDHHKYHTLPSTSLDKDEIESLMKVIDLIELAVKTPDYKLFSKHDVLITQVDLFFEYLNIFRYDQDHESFGNVRNYSLFNDFCDLLSKHYQESHEVNFYAEKLHFSPKYFSKVIYETKGMTAGRWIEQYIIAKTKQLLVTRQDLTIQQIAYMVGFNEQSAFCRFFKRSTGLTPKAFRRQHE